MDDYGFSEPVISEPTGLILPVTSNIFSLVEREELGVFVSAEPSNFKKPSNFESRWEISVLLSDGEELPSWLSFNQNSWVFELTKTPDRELDYEIKVTLTDRWGPIFDENYQPEIFDFDLKVISPTSTDVQMGFSRLDNSFAEPGESIEVKFASGYEHLKTNDAISTLWYRDGVLLTDQKSYSITLDNYEPGTVVRAEIEIDGTKISPIANHVIVETDDMKLDKVSFTDFVGGGGIETISLADIRTSVDGHEPNALNLGEVNLSYTNLSLAKTDIDSFVSPYLTFEIDEQIYNTNFSELTFSINLKVIEIKNLDGFDETQEIGEKAFEIKFQTELGNISSQQNLNKFEPLIETRTLGSTSYNVAGEANYYSSPNSSGQTAWITGETNETLEFSDAGELIFRPLALLKNFPSNDLVLRQLPLEEGKYFMEFSGLPFEYQGIEVDLLHINLDIA